MAQIEHKNITGSDLHEPKGISTASLGTVYTSNGSGSGTWVSPTAAVKNANIMTFHTVIPDISTASSVWAVTPIAGVISKIYVVLRGPITVANATVSAKINGVAVGASTITVAQSGSAAGSSFACTPSSSNTVAGNGTIEIVNAAGSTGTVAADVTVVLNVA